MNIPSKRSVKNKSGRVSRRQRQATIQLQMVGGKLNLVKAIYAPSDEPLCHIVDDNQNKFDKRYTAVVGGSCSTGYIGGRGV